MGYAWFLLFLFDLRITLHFVVGSAKLTYCNNTTKQASNLRGCSFRRGVTPCMFTGQTRYLFKTHPVNLITNPLGSNRYSKKGREAANSQNGRS